MRFHTVLFSFDVFSNFGLPLLLLIRPPDFSSTLVLQISHNFTDFYPLYSLSMGGGSSGKVKVGGVRQNDRCLQK